MALMNLRLTGLGGALLAVLFWALWLLTQTAPAPAVDQQRIALLIGNAKYSGAIKPLANPLNDIALLEGKLMALGFDVVTVPDAGLAEMTRAINRYVAKLRRAGSGAVGFFYYSGHGAQNADTRINYLIPTDVTTDDSTLLWTDSYRLRDLIVKLKDEAPDANHFVVFDACRNELRLRTPDGKTAASQAKGFEPERDLRGILVAYATEEGAIASDAGSGAGPYATALAEHLPKPGIEAVTMFRHVQLDVQRRIGQKPYLDLGGVGEVYLAGRDAAPVQPDPPVRPPMSEAAQAWVRVDGTKNAALLQAFIAQYPGTVQAILAGDQLEALQPTSSAVGPIPINAGLASAGSEIEEAPTPEAESVQLAAIPAEPEPPSEPKIEVETEASAVEAAQLDPPPRANYEPVCKMLTGSNPSHGDAGNFEATAAPVLDAIEDSSADCEIAPSPHTPRQQFILWNDLTVEETRENKCYESAYGDEVGNCREFCNSETLSGDDFVFGDNIGVYACTKLLQGETYFELKERAHYKVGRHFYEAGRTECAINSFAAAIRYNPEYSTPAKSLIHLLRKTDYQSEALALSNYAIALFKRDVELIQWRAELNEAAGKKDEAARDYCDYFGTYDSGLDSLAELARSLMQEKHFLGAKVAFQTWLENEPGSFAAKAGLARTNVKLGEFEEGLQNINDAIAAYSSEAVYFDIRAHIYQALGRADDAFTDYERAISLDTRGDLLRRYQDGLYSANLYSGETDGLYGPGTNAALLACVQRTDCDPYLEDDKDADPWQDAFEPG